MEFKSRNINRRMNAYMNAVVVSQGEEISHRSIDDSVRHSLQRSLPISPPKDDKKDGDKKKCQHAFVKQMKKLQKGKESMKKRVGLSLGRTVPVSRTFYDAQVSLELRPQPRTGKNLEETFYSMQFNEGPFEPERQHS